MVKKSPVNPDEGVDVEKQESKEPLSKEAKEQQPESTGGEKTGLDKKEDEPLLFLDKETLEEYRNDKKFCCLRWSVFTIFLVIWLALLAGAILIIVLTPKNSQNLWYKKAIVFKHHYKVDSDSDYSYENIKNLMRSYVNVYVNGLIIDYTNFNKEHLKTFKEVADAEKVQLYPGILIIDKDKPRTVTELLRDGEYRKEYIEKMVEIAHAGYKGVYIDTKNAEPDDINQLLDEARSHVNEKLEYVFDSHFIFIVGNEKLLLNLNAQIIYYEPNVCTISEVISDYKKQLNSTNEKSVYARSCKTIKIEKDKDTINLAYRLMFIFNYFAYEHTYIINDSDLWFQNDMQRDIKIIKEVRQKSVEPVVGYPVNYVLRKINDAEYYVLVFNDLENELEFSYQDLLPEYMNITKGSVILPVVAKLDVEQNTTLDSYGYEVLKFTN